MVSRSAKQERELWSIVQVLYFLFKFEGLGDFILSSELDSDLPNSDSPATLCRHRLWLDFRCT